MMKYQNNSRFRALGIIHFQAKSESALGEPLLDAYTRTAAYIHNNFVIPLTHRRLPTLNEHHNDGMLSSIFSPI